MFCKNKQCLLGKQERTYKLDSYIDVTIIEKQTNRKYKKMQNFHPTGVCPIRDILSHLSSKWATLILITLNANKTMRFSDIQKSIGGISQTYAYGNSSISRDRRINFQKNICRNSSPSRIQADRKRLQLNSSYRRSGQLGY